MKTAELKYKSFNVQNRKKMQIAYIMKHTTS